MNQAFVIMQIGNSELDRIFSEVINPTVIAAGLSPAKRIDKHNEGRLLKSEITALIEDSDIVIADLTNERPNCYLEVGYAMGRNRFRNLILLAREDHNSDSPNYKPGGKKVHFDLSGYDILFWDPNSPNEFQTELKRRIQRRLNLLVASDGGFRSEDSQLIRRPEIIFVDEKTVSLRSLYAKNVGTGPAINIVRVIINPGDLTNTTPNEPLPLAPLAPLEQVYAYCATLPPIDSVSIIEDPKFQALIEYDDTLRNHFETDYKSCHHSIKQISKRMFPLDRAATV
jgi:hypothetical protein